MQHRAGGAGGGASSDAASRRSRDRAAAARGLDLLGQEADRLSPTSAGLLLALLAATAFGTAAIRVGRPEEWAAVGAGAVSGLLAGATTSATGAWGQVGLQLAVAGAAAGCYAIVARPLRTAAVSVTDLVVASWIAIAGAGVDTPEAYTLPAATGLLLIAIPARGCAPVRRHGPPKAAVGVALVPSAFVVLAAPTALRMVLVVAAAVVLTVVGTAAHRQAPFVVGTGVLLFVVVGRLAPYAPLLPRWLTLWSCGPRAPGPGCDVRAAASAGPEAVAWVGQMT